MSIIGFENVEYLIEANEFARHTLSKQYCKSVKWINEIGCKWGKIGYVTGDDRGVMCRFFFSRLNGKLICFYEPVSILVDYDMIDDWIKNNIKCKNKTDAMNFHEVINYVTKK